jgi:hypothetical protein
LVRQIGFIADEDGDDVGAGNIADILEPATNAVKRIAVVEVEEEKRTGRAAIVAARDSYVGRPTTTILQLDAVFVGLYDFREEFDAEGWLGLFVKKITNKSDQKTGLTGVEIANNDDFEKSCSWLKLSSRCISFAERDRHHHFQIGIEGGGSRFGRDRSSRISLL